MNIISVFIFLVGCSLSLAQYEANWESIDSRPLPSWYDEAKIGIFVHWGVFSVPSFGSEWFWWNWQGSKNQAYIDFMEQNYPPDFTYPDFAPDFTTEFFDPNEWAEIFKSSGARYVVLTSKHHEGYTLWPSKYSFNWNAMDVGPHRDLVGDLATAVRAQDVRFGLYHSLYEWFHPLYLDDKNNNYQTDEFVKTKVLPEMYEVVNAYEPDILWSDGDWEAPDTYWNSTEFLAWLYNESPVREKVVTNDRWGQGVSCNHGGFLSCSDRYLPGTVPDRKWENAMTLDKNSWGYRRNGKLSDYFSIEELLANLAQTLSFGGNILINVGPTKDGKIVPIYEERLRQLGEWLSTNGEAVYGSKPWTAQNDTITSGVWFTQSASGDAVYATVLSWPTGSTLNLGAISADEITTISVLGYDGNLEWTTTETGIAVSLPLQDDISSKWAWVLKFTSGSRLQ